VPQLPAAKGKLQLTAEPSSPLSIGSLPPGRVDALYVHVPFCAHKCHYCDFYSITRQPIERMERFVDLVLAEARLWTQGASPALVIRPRTIFFGGGTPSLLPLEPMRRLLAGIAELFDLSQVNEWTVEVNPATASDEYCRMLRESSPDRLSFGAQSFDPAELAVLERHHDPLDVGRSIAAARAAGFTRLNLDLIYAVPGQTIESWQRSLEAALELEPPHLSCYGLTYEPNTPLAVRKRMGRVSAVEESLELAMMHLTRRRLADAGRPAYEISNFAIPGEECRHNLLYWTGGNYIGLGPAAASHVEGWRWRNRPHLGEWERALADRQLPAIEAETLTPAARHGELAMLMLRLSRGLNFSDFADRTGRDARKLFAEPIERLVPNGLLSIDQTALRLTDRGLEVADAVAAEFLNALA
jgi:oxygen-independent coproporphyrinogen-3 oxidase